MASFVSVSLLDCSTRTFFVDETTTCSELADILTKHIELVERADDFRFFLSVKTKEIILSAESLIQNAIQDCKTSFPSCGEPRVVFKRAFFDNPREEEITDPVLARLMFHQAKMYALAGMWPVPADAVPELAGLLVTATFGPPSEEHGPGLLRGMMREFVPTSYLGRRKEKAWEALVLEAHRAHDELGREDAEKRFLAAVRARAECFGALPFPGVCLRIGVNSTKARVLLAADHEGLHIFNAKDMSAMNFFAYDSLLHWFGEGTMFTVSVATAGAAENEGISVVFRTSYAPELEYIINEYTYRSDLQKEQSAAVPPPDVQPTTEPAAEADAEPDTEPIAEPASEPITETPK
eukprot:gnl/Chilomastix_cuspidata/3067.p1 GENE.gnl/Chilomastix_cuspidata/3067~~gnl/Chilomastix_cuspidata/3067.p1  ORF type:complete len:351 (-),score=116.20 gnl/Chilomastix_cuspidata/3067:59-1111(-)